MLDGEQAENFDRAIDLLAKGRLSDAKLMLEDIAFDGRSPDAFFMIGIIHLKRKKNRDALLCFLTADRMKNDEWLYKTAIGDAFFKEKSYEKARNFYLEALDLLPENDKPVENLVRILAASGNSDEAKEICRSVLRHNPRSIVSAIYLARLQSSDFEFDEAVACLREAIRHNPKRALLYQKLGMELFHQGKMAEAIAVLDVGIALKGPALWASMHKLRALCLLCMGDFEKGLPEYEWRIAEVGLRYRHNRWHGESIAGKTLLVRSEQGYGDTIQFSRYLLMAEASRRLIFEIRPELFELFQSLPPWIELVRQGAALPHIDYEVRLLSLPFLQKTRPDTIPPPLPLAADPRRVAHWRAKLSELHGKKIGLAWSGNPTFPLDHLRSVPLELFEPLGAVSGLVLVSLQKGPGSRQLVENKTHHIYIHDWTDDLADFADTAALIENLDLVVSVDTSVVHLAASLGKPVWMLSRLLDPHWVWQLNETESPWYPTLTIVRQKVPGDWSDAIGRVKACLEAFASECATTTELGGRLRRASPIEPAPRSDVVGL